MEKTNVVGKKNGWSIWATIAFVLFWLVGLTVWSYYEKNLLDEMKKDQVVASGKPILHISKQSADDLCECPKPKAKASRKKSETKQKPIQQAITKPPFVVDEVIAGWRSTPKAVTVDATQKAEIKPVLDTVDPDYGKTEVVFTPLPEREAEPPRVGRKILVIRQQPVMPYYGGYSSGYSYAPQVVYGSQYVPPPQQVFVPAPPVIVHAPSVVTPAPSVVTPAGGYKPGYTTKPAGPGYVTNQAL